VTPLQGGDYRGENEMTKTVAALFRDYDDAQSAVNSLLGVGFDRATIDMLANNKGERFAAGPGGSNTAPSGGEVLTGAFVGAGEGAAIGGLTGLAVGLATLLIPGVGPVLAIGPLAATIFGAELGALGGGMIAAFTRLGLTEDEATHYAEGIRGGGTLVTVQIDSPAAARLAADVLDRFAPLDLSWGSWKSFPNGVSAEPSREAAAPATRSLNPDDFAEEDSLTETDPTEPSGIRTYAARL
jgi:hypothetical protein